MAHKKQLRLTHARDEYLTRRKFAEATERNYRAMFTTLIESIGSDIYLASVTASHLSKYLSRYDHAASSNMRFSQVKAFFGWCVRNDYLRKDPTVALERRRVPQQGALTRHRIPVEEWPAILDIAGAQHPLNRAVTAVGLYTGQRGSELAGIRVSDVHRDSDGVIVSIRVNRTKVGVVADVPVFAELADELEVWLEWYRSRHGDAFGNLPPNAYLLPRRKRQPERVGRRFTRLNPDTDVEPFNPMPRPYKVVQQVLQAAGWYQRGEGGHTLRRSLAVTLYQTDLDAGYSEALENVKNMLGHQSVTTTEGYLGSSLGSERLAKRVQRNRLRPASDQSNVVQFRREDHG